MKLRLLALLALLSAPPLAGAADQATALRTALSAINAQQQAIYQQFQMLQSMHDQSQGIAYAPPPPGPPQNYDDIVQQRQAAIDRSKRLQDDMDALLTRYQRLEEDKQPLLAEMRELALQPPAAATPAPAPRTAARPRPR